MAKNKNGLEKDKKKKLPFNVLSKKGLAALALAGVMIASPLMLAGCSNGKDGKDGLDGAKWYSGIDYSVDSNATNAKVGDFYIDTDDYILYQKQADGTWVVLMQNFGRPGQEATAPTVSINGAGYWVINGVPTQTKAEGQDGTTPTITINDKGYWVINGTPTDVRAEAIDGTNGKDGNTWTVGTEYPSTPKSGDIFLNNSTWEVYQYNGTTWESKGNIKGQDGTNGTNGTAGATWLTGTLITGKDSSITAEVAGAKVGDLYFNTSTQDVYQCTATNTWSWISNLKGQVDQVVKAKPVIFDTDFLDDVDDAVSIRLLLWAEQHGMCDIVGLVLDAVNDNNAQALSRFLDYEGRGDLPFAVEKDNVISGGNTSYLNTIISNWDTGMYDSTDDCIDENNGEYYVELLRNVPEGETCNIICVGYGTALAGLMNRAEADPEIMELVKTKVDTIYMMGGKYPSGGVENNLGRNEKVRQAGHDICAKTPSEVSIVFLGFEVGESVLTGGTVDDTLGTSDLLAQVLSAYGSSSGRSSWDPMTTLLAVYDNPSSAGYNLVQGTNSVNASTGANTFTQNSTGNHYYVTKKFSDTYYKHAIDSILEKNAWEHREVGRITYDPHSVILSLQSISIETQPTKTDYLTGETFSTNGMVVKATYIDENTGATKVRTITDYTFSPENFTTTGQQQVTISYTHEGITKTAEVSVNVSAPAEYTISVTNTNGTFTGDPKIIQNQTASVTLVANSNYKLPATITVTGADYEYNRLTGVVTLSNPTGNVTITAECAQEVYFTISTNITHGSYTGDTSVKEGESASVTLTANSEYKLPTTITVTGASYNYDSSTGVVTLTNLTGNVTITAECIEISAYTITTNVKNGSSTGDVKIVNGSTATISLAADENYSLPAVITVTGADYEYNKSAGTITLSNATNNVEITVGCFNPDEYHEVVFDGDENWKFNTDKDCNEYGIYNCYLIDSSIVPAKSTVAEYATDRTNCKYGYITCSDTRFGTDILPREDATELGVGYYFNDPSIYFRFDSSIATTVEGFKAFLAANPVAVYIQKV